MVLICFCCIAGGVYLGRKAFEKRKGDREKYIILPQITDMRMV
jgi:hypothetical protein